MAGRWSRVTQEVAAAALVESARRSRVGRVSAAEERAFRSANDAPDSIHPPVWAVMQSGSLAAVHVVAADLWRRGRRPQALATAITGTAVWGGVKAVKPLIGRGRPSEHLDGVAVRGKPQTGLGYPSGHAAVALTIALIATQGCRPAVRAVGVSVAGFTGWARMYVGAHLPLDVVGGLAIGTVCGRLAESVLDHYEDALADQVLRATRSSDGARS